MSLSVDDLRVTLRRDLDDPLVPGENDDDVPPDQDCLWSENDLTSYILRTQKTLARRLYLIRDRFDLTLVADQVEYNVPEWFLKSYSAFINDATKRSIDVLNLNELEEGRARWDDYDLPNINAWRTSTGAPRALLFEERYYKVSVIPAPTSSEAGTLIRVTCARLPKDSSLDACLEITQDLYEDAYLFGSRMLAYSKEDVDLLDTASAATYELKFMTEIDRLRGETHQRTRKAGTVMYGGL